MTARRSCVLGFGFLFTIVTLVVLHVDGYACDGCGCGTHCHSNGHSHNHRHGGHESAGQLSVASRGGAHSRFGGTVTFAVVGDTQGGEFGGGVLDELTRDINAQNPDFVLFPGDLVADSGSSGWAAWKATTAVLGNRRLMTPGNHDRGSGASFSSWRNTFDWLPNSQNMGGIQGIDAVDYFVDSGNVRFISIGTDLPGQFFGGGSPAALAWLEQVMVDVDIRNADANPNNDIDHVFTFSHRPVTTQQESGTGGTDGDWWRTMTGQAGSSDAVSAALLPGHWHMYQPSRPDPRVDTMEIISGTGGGGLEGAPIRNQHGFSLITVNGGNVTSQFFGDRSGSSGGWNFVDELDTFAIRQEGGLPTGELALYAFDGASFADDTSLSTLSKAHQLSFNGTATQENDALRGDVLRVNAGGYADARNVGDNNLAVLGDLTISFHARAADSEGGTLAAFGGAFGSFNGSLNAQESANHAYKVDLTRAGFLELSWQHDDGSWDSVLSNEFVADPLEWHEYEIQRDADSQGVAFFVDGQQLGDALMFDFLPTGAGSGSLYIGAGVGGATGFNGWLDEFRLSNDPVMLIPLITGDFNGDGLINGLDWLFFADGLGTTGVGGTDLNGDGLTNYPDFLLFIDIFDSHNGQGSFQAMLATIPEPATSTMALLIVIVGIRLVMRRG